MQQPRIVRRRNAFPIRKTTGLVALVLIVLTGVTYAALQTQAILKNNTIQTAVANMQISTDGTNYVSSTSPSSGYAFSGLIPGGSPMPANGNPVYLKNAGTTSLSVRLSVNGPISNPDNVDLTKVRVILTPARGGAAQTITLADLIAASTSNGVALTQAGLITPSAVNQVLLQVALDSDAVNGSSANIGNIDFNFSAIAVN